MTICFAIYILVFQINQNIITLTDNTFNNKVQPNKHNKSIYEQGFKNYQNAVNQVSPLFQ